MKNGYTTGTCAAAAAGAAVLFLCTGCLPDFAEVFMPDGAEVFFPIEAVSDELLPEILKDTVPMKHSEDVVPVLCGVRKDAGDDPDVTNGALVVVSAARIPEELWGGKVMDPIVLPDGRLCYQDEQYPGLWLTGGRGIGRVTKRGLACPAGYHAINPVPRQMIFAQADRARREAGCPELPLLLTVSIPEGEALASRTFNPNLGIQGGISVLGTTGIVHPMSEAALVETIRLDIRIRTAEGRRILAVAPGNYGGHYLRKELGLSVASFVKCSNYIGDTFQMMKEEGIGRVLLAGHPGKLVKVAGGMLNTHSRHGDRRMEILSTCALEAGMNQEQTAPLAAMNTTEEAVEYLEALGWLSQVFGYVAAKIKSVLEARYGLETEVILFSTERGYLAGTAGARLLADILKDTEINYIEMDETI